MPTQLYQQRPTHRVCDTVVRPDTPYDPTPVQRRLTPLGALPRLQRDDRESDFTPSDHALLKVIVQRCEKVTGELITTLEVLAGKCGWRSNRTASRRLNYLDSVGILTYLPGSGRGARSRIILLFETWGERERVTPVSTFNETPYKEHTRVSTPTKKVRYSQPSPQAARDYTHPDPEIKNSIERGVKAFHEKLGSEVDLSIEGFLEMESRKLCEIRERFSEERRQAAWQLLQDEYRYKKRKPFTIGILRKFCKELEDIQRHHEQVKRLRTYHKKKAERKVDRMREAIKNSGTEVQSGIPAGADPEMWPKWVEVCKELRSITLDQNYKRYIEPLIPVKSENGTWVIQAPSDEVKKRVEKHYVGEFEKTIGESVKLQV